MFENSNMSNNTFSVGLVLDLLFNGHQFESLQGHQEDLLGR